MRPFLAIFVVAVTIAGLVAARPMMRGTPAGDTQATAAAQTAEAAHNEHDGHDHAPVAQEPHANHAEQVAGTPAGLKPGQTMTPAECSAYCNRIMREKGMDGQCPENLCTTNLCPMHERVVAATAKKPAS